MNPWLHTRAERLWLDLPTQADVDDLFAIHADPAVWSHYPVGRHTSRSQPEEMVAQSARQFEVNGLARRAVEAARAVAPERPNPDPDAIRLVYADREATPELVAAGEAHARG